MRRFAVALAVAGLVGSVAWACGSDDPSDPGNQNTVREIHLTAASLFTPSTLTIPAGTTVRWINDVAVMHTITPENTSQPGVWQRRVVNNSGERFEHTFTVSGQTYRYRCEPHSPNFTQGMVGTIIVQ